MKKTRKLLGVFLTLLMSFAIMNIANNNDISAAPIAVDDMGELATAIQAADEDTTIELSNSFDTSPTTQASVTISNSANITIEGNGKVIDGSNLPDNAKHLAITNNGTGTLTFQNITFAGDPENSGSTITGGGLNFTNGNYSFNNVTISNNRVGVNLNNVNNFEVNESTFDTNYNPGYGASAINAEAKVNNLNIKNTSFINNYGDGGSGVSTGAIWIKYPQTVTIDQSYFKGNAANSSGGGAAIAFTVAQSNNINITNSYFEDNKTNYNPSTGSAWADGGAIYYYGQAGGTNPYFNVDSCTFVNNYAHDDGGAILIEQPTASGQAIVSNSTFSGNRANGKGSQGFQDSSGGAIQIAIDTNIDLVNNTFYANVSGGSGAFHNNQKGGAIATHNEGGRNAPINSYNNIFLDNYAEDSSGVRINEEYANVHAEIFTNFNSIGVDNGTTVDSNLVNVQTFFGTDTPTLQANYDVSSIGNPNSSYTIGYLPTLTIVPDGLADGTGISTSLAPLDARKVARETTPDVGAIEISYMKFDANGGTWKNLPALTYDGTKYYSASETDTYYLVAYNTATLNTLDDTNLENDDKQFLGWSTSETATTAEYTANQAITLNGSDTLYAVWNNDTITTKHTVTFETNGGSAIASVEVEDGNAVSKPNEPTREGYKFLGWFLDDETFANTYDFTTLVTTDVTLYANWEKVTDPVDPVDPVDPIDPVDPVDPVDPIDPTDPVDPVKPTEPTNPTKPTNPSEPIAKPATTQNGVTSPATGDTINVTLLLTLILLAGSSLVILKKVKY